MAYDLLLRNGPEFAIGWVRHTTISDKLLLYLAFVNMTKGIGRGW